MLLLSKIKIHVIQICMTACNLFVRVSSIPTFWIKWKNNLLNHILSLISRHICDNFAGCKFKIISCFAQYFSCYLSDLCHNKSGEVRKCTQNVREFKLSLPLGTLLNPIQLLSGAVLSHTGSDEIYEDDNLYLASLRLLVLGHTEVGDNNRQGEWQFSCGHPTNPSLWQFVCGQPMTPSSRTHWRSNAKNYF